MLKKLYVGGLPYSTTEEELRTAFAQAGTVVSVQIIKDKFSGQSKGFGFVEMETEDGAESAVKMWDGQPLGGRPLKVNEAKPMTDRPPRNNNFQKGPRQGGYNSNQNHSSGGRRSNFGDDEEGSY